MKVGKAGEYMETYEKLKILADSAKYDVSCSSSGTQRPNGGGTGHVVEAGICHSWSDDGRCISLLKVLLSNKCVYNCEYCVNRRSANVKREAFDPPELAKLIIEFYKRNYIEGLFLSSAIDVSPDDTAERMMECLWILRDKWQFEGYIHAKIVPGASPELLAPHKTVSAIYNPMKQITNSLIDRNNLKGPGIMFEGINLNSPENYLSGDTWTSKLYNDPDITEIKGICPVSDKQGTECKIKERKAVVHREKYRRFAPAGQTTQMVVGALGENDRKIIKMAENIYRTFKVKRVYYSGYIALVDSPLLPPVGTPPPLLREHRLYQADWLLRFYGFQAYELLDREHPFLDEDLDLKISWALRNPEFFP